MEGKTENGSPPADSTVAVLESSYRQAEERIRQAFCLLDYRPRRERILLKPNLVTYPRWLFVGATPPSAITDPRFIEALLRVFSGYQVTIAEGAIAGYDTDKVFRRTGMVELAKRYGAELVDLDRCQRREVEWKYGRLLMPELLQTHEYINVPKLKTHITTGVTIGCKNQKGLLRGKDKIRFHKELDLHDAIAALAAAVRPDLTIVDGIVGMDGGGPTMGRSRKARLVVAGRDPRAVDVACCDLISVPLERVPHLQRVPYRTVGRPPVDLRQRFLLPDRLVVANVHIHAVDATCSRCLQSAHNGLAATARSPYYTMRALWSCVVKRTDIITGQGEIIPDGVRGRVICYGKCTEKLAEKHGLPWIPGCPPKVKDFLRLY